MKTLLQRTILFTTAAVGLALTSPALAQDTTPPAAGTTADDGDEIVVTARRRAELLQDVPIAITYFNQQQLTNNNVVNAQDLAIYTPSLSANANFGNENTTFAIRGFTQEIGTAPSVGVYFADVITPRGATNGFPTGDGLAPGTLFDLQNVQVLKGPQGTLFGRNTTGGAVLVVPQKPIRDFEGYVEGSAGNHNMWRVQGVINVPVAEQLRVRIGVDRMKREGFLHNVSGIGPDDFGDVDYLGARLGVVVDITPDIENYTIVQYNRSDTHGPIQKLVAANAAQGLGFVFASQMARQGSDFYNVMQNLPDAFSKVRQWQAINTTTWQVSDTLTVKNIFSYGKLKQTMFTPLFGTDGIIDLGFLGLGSYHVPFSAITNPPGVPTANESTLVEELQIQGHTADDRLEWQVGGYYERARPHGQVGSQSPFLSSCIDVQTFQCTDPVGLLTSLFPPVNPLTGQPAFPPGSPIHVGTINYTVGETWFRDIGLYAQGTYKFSDEFKVTTGFRYTWDKAKNVSEQRVFVVNYPPLYGLVPPPLNPFFNSGQTTNPRCTKPEAIPTGCISTYNQSSSAPTWTIDLQYTPNPNLMTYVKYSRGYRSGTIAANVSTPLNIVKPEKVDTFELGLKTSFSGAVRGTFNGAIFYNDFTNQQIQVGFNAIPGSGQASTAAPFNVPKSKVWGFELDGTVSPFEGLELAAGYTFLRTKIREVPDLSGISDPNFIIAPSFHVGDSNPLSPRHKLTVSATYTLPLDESIGKVSFGAVLSYRSHMLVNYHDRENPDPSIAQFGTLPGLTLLNLNFNWESVAGMPVDLGLFATNVTKKKYYTFAPGLGSPQVGFETAVVGEPRMFGARAKFRFGAAAD